MRFIFIFLFFMVFIDAKDYTQNKHVQAFIENISKEHKIDKGYLQKLFSNVKVYKTPLKIYRPKSKRSTTKAKSTKRKKRTVRHGSWDRYSRLKISSSRVKQGVQFIQKYQSTFNDVEKRYGVPKEYIAAIIGIETIYGRDVGNYLVFDNLVTLAFEKNRRNTFFKKELKKFLLLSQKEKFNPRNVKGSYAGAIGLGQFIPSNYEAYGVDENKDGRITLQKPEDAIASVANYFKKNGWRIGEPVATRVSYEGKRFRRLKTGYRTRYNRKNLKGITPKMPWNYLGEVRLIKLDKKEYDELWYGAKNFFVITRYNHSAYYAMSVYQLAQKLKKKLNEN